MFKKFAVRGLLPALLGLSGIAHGATINVGLFAYNEQEMVLQLNGFAVSSIGLGSGEFEVVPPGVSFTNLQLELTAIGGATSFLSIPSMAAAGGTIISSQIAASTQLASARLTGNVTPTTVSAVPTGCMGVSCVPSTVTFSPASFSVTLGGSSLTAGTFGVISLNAVPPTSPVPEPTTLLLSAAGLVAVGLIGRRSRLN